MYSSRLSPYTGTRGQVLLTIAPGYAQEGNDRRKIFPHILVADGVDDMGSLLEDYTFGRTRAKRNSRIYASLERAQWVQSRDSTILLPNPVATIFHNSSLRARLLLDVNNKPSVIITQKGTSDRPYVWTAWGELGSGN